MAQSNFEESPVSQSEEKSPLWESLSRELESRGEDGVKLGTLDPSQPVSPLDRLASTFLDGTLATFILCVAACAHLGTYMSLAWIILSLPVAVLVAPLSRGRGGTSALRLLLLALPILILNNFAMVLVPAKSLAVENRAPWFEMALQQLQWFLESALAGRHLALYAGVLLLVMGLRPCCRKYFPWIDVAPVGRARTVLALLLVLFPAVSWLALTLSSPLGSEDEQWMKQSQVMYEQTSLAGKPIADGSEVWQKRSRRWFKEHGERVYKVHQFPTKKAYTQLESDVRGLLKDSPPNSREELDAARQLITILLKPYHGENNRPEFLEQPEELAYRHLEIAFTTRPEYQYLTSVELFSDYLLPALLRDNLHQEGLTLRLDRLKALDAALLTEEQEFRLNAYDFLQNPGEFDSYLSRGELASRHQWKAPPPRPMQLWGAECSSPPQLLAEQRIRTRANEFLSYWRALEPLNHEERSRELRRLLDEAEAGVQPARRNRSFLENLSGRTYSRHLRPWVETSLLVIQLRQAKLNNGSYPSSLAELKISAEHWQWEEVEAGWQLADTRLREYKKGRPLFRWVLP